MNQGFDYDYAAYYVFLIFAPILIVLSWGATLFIDTPATDLVRVLDANARVEQPKPRPGKKPVV